MLKNILERVVKLLLSVYEELAKIRKDVGDAKRLIGDVLRVQEEQNRLLRRTGGDKKKIMEEVSKQ